MQGNINQIPDFYKLLNLPFGSTNDLIKKNFRDLAKTYHPDNRDTGSSEKFLLIHNAYTILSSNQREKYDIIYKKIYQKNKNTFLLPQNRIIYTTSMSKLAKMGLMKSGLRRKDRLRFTGVFHDLDILVKESEKKFKVIVKLPLIVRILCPDCMGSRIFCDVCGGIGTYKSTRNLQVTFEPHLLENGRIYELELSRFRPDKFIHFKKKYLRVRINILS